MGRVCMHSFIKLCSSFFTDDLSAAEKDPELNLKGKPWGKQTANDECGGIGNTLPSLPAGYPRNPYNDIVCNDTIAASGVFTAKELFRLSKCEFGTYRSEFDRFTTAIRSHLSFTLGCLLLAAVTSPKVAKRENRRGSSRLIDLLCVATPRPPAPARLLWGLLCNHLTHSLTHSPSPLPFRSLHHDRIERHARRRRRHQRRQAGGAQRRRQLLRRRLHGLVERGRRWCWRLLLQLLYAACTNRPRVALHRVQ